MGYELEREGDQYRPTQDVPAGMLFWQFIASTLSAGILTGVLAYGWLLQANIDTRCGSGASGASIFSGLAERGECISAIRGWPEILFGNGGLLVGSLLGVLLIGYMGGC